MGCAKGEANTPFGQVLGSGGGGRLQFKCPERKVEARVWEDGYYYVEKPLGPTCWTVRYKPEGGKYGPVSPPCVDIPPISFFYRQDFLVPAKGCVPVWGTVTGTKGEPVTACQEITFGEFGTVTDPRGTFATALPPGDYEVKVNGTPVDRLVVNGQSAQLAIPEPPPIALEIAVRNARTAAEGEEG